MKLRNGWDYFYCFFWKTGLTLNAEELKKTSFSRFKSFFGLTVLISAYYNFPYLFLGKKLGLPLDDAWIHMTYAKNIYLYNRFSFDGLTLSTGATSFLWPELISLVSSFKPSATIAFIHMFNAAVFFILICSWYQIALYMFLDETLAFLTAFLLPFCGNLLWITFSGMESMLFLCLGITTIYFFGKRHYIITGIMSACIVMTRPEGITLPIAFATIELYRLFRRSEMNYRDSMFLFIPPTVSFLVYYAFNIYINGGRHILGTSFMGRRWLYCFPAHVPLLSGTYYGAKNLLHMWYGQMIYYSSGWGWIGSSPLFRGSITVPLKFVGMSFFLCGVIFYLISFFRGIRPKYSFYPKEYVPDPFGFLKKNRGWKRMELPLVLWTFYHNLSYSFFLPHIGHGGRYQPINLIWMVLFFVLGVRGCGEILSVIFKKRKTAIKYSLSLLFFVIVSMQLWYWGFVYQGCVNHINKIHIKTAEWVEKNIPIDEKIAAFDIGAMAFFSDRDVVDMGGLIDPEFASYLYKGSVVPYLRGENIKYIAVVKNKSNRMMYRLGLCQADGKDFELEPVYDVKLEADERFHLPPTGIAFPEICIYKVEWKNENSA